MSPGRKVFGVVFSVLLVAASLLEIYLQMISTSIEERTFHRVGFFGFLILSHLVTLEIPRDKST